MDPEDRYRETKSRAGSEYRNVLRAPHRSQSLRVPPGAVLDFGVALAELNEAGPAERVRFTLSAEGDGGRTTLFSRTLSPRDQRGPGWNDVRVDLSALANAEVRFVFETESVDSNGNAVAGRARAAVWSNPVLSTPSAGRAVETPNIISRTVQKTLDRAAAWLARHGQLRFFMFLHTCEIHWPYSSPEPYGHMFTREGSSSEDFKVTRGIEFVGGPLTEAQMYGVEA